MPSLPIADVRHVLACLVVRGLTTISRGTAYSHPMSTLVLRKSVDDERVGGPYSCASANEMARVLGFLTLEERLPWLLATHETTREIVRGQYQIYHGQELVGYLVVISNE